MISKIKFSELLQNEIGESLDRHFAKNGWALQRWDDGQEVGYQVYFGKGEQVDNHYEYGFPYLFDQAEVEEFASTFYYTHIKHVLYDRAVRQDEKTETIPSALDTSCTEDRFWNLIQSAKINFGQDIEATAVWLTDQLIEQGVKAAMWFHMILQIYLEIASVFGLWDAASLITGGCSDDAFLYFRCWLIAQGKEVYLAAMKDPDTLVEVEPYACCRFESLDYVGLTAYKKLTGKNICDEMSKAQYQTELYRLSSKVIRREGIIYPRDRKGTAAYFPRLWAKYGRKKPTYDCQWNTSDAILRVLLEEGRCEDRKKHLSSTENVDRDPLLPLNVEVTGT